MATSGAATEAGQRRRPALRLILGCLLLVAVAIGLGALVFYCLQDGSNSAPANSTSAAATTTPLPHPINTTITDYTPVDTTSASVLFVNSREEEARLRTLVAAINEKQLPWTAEYNVFSSTLPWKQDVRAPGKYDYRSLVAKGLSEDESLRRHLIADTRAHLDALTKMHFDLPAHFDARARWAHCRSVHELANQGACGSCWAASITSMMADRICISSNASSQPTVSIEDLVSCCEYCGGCAGIEYGMFALIYLKRTGVVTGGGSGSGDGCRPYSIAAECGAPCPRYYYNADNTPQCARRCQPSYTANAYENDLMRARSAYWLAMRENLRDLDSTRGAFVTVERLLRGANVTAIEAVKRELLLYGPTVITISVRESLLHYRSGVYTDPNLPDIDSSVYGHLMKVVGWGVEGGEEYWIVANSWGRQWGEDGFGRISTAYPYSMMAGRF